MTWYGCAVCIITFLPEMPRYITRIEGYSKKAERTFFRDKSGLALVSSRNCSQFEATAETEYPLDLAPAQVIPGTPNNGFKIVEWAGSDYKGKLAILPIYKHATTFLRNSEKPFCEKKTQNSSFMF